MRYFYLGFLLAGFLAFSANAQQASGTVGSSNPQPYLGLVSTRGLIPTNTLGSGSATYQISQTMTWLRDNFVNGSVLVPNFSINSSNSEVGIGAGTITVAIASVATGPYTTCATSQTMPNGITVVPCNGVTLAKGTQAWVCMIYVNSNGVTFEQTAGEGFDATEGWQFGTGTPPTVSSCGSVSDSSGFHYQGYRPLGLVSQTILPSGVIIGDSRGFGLYDGKTTALGDQGNVARWIGPRFAYSNPSVSATLLSGYLSGSHAYRDILISYASFVVDQLGINDMTGGASAATVAANRATFAALYPNASVYGTTIEPTSTSTDSFATTTNQTATNQVKFSQFNATERTGIAGEKLVFDIAQAVDPYQTNIWPVSANPAATTTVCAGLSATAASTAGVMTVSAVASGALSVGCPLVVTGAPFPGSYVTSLISGTGSTGTYGVLPVANFSSNTIINGEFATIDGTHETSVMNALIAVRLGAFAALAITR